MKLTSYADLFPEGWDYPWLAIDAEGHIGIFTNAGEGPIPIAVLADRATVDRTLWPEQYPTEKMPTAVWANRAAVDRAEELVRKLPERSEYRMLATRTRPDDFIGFARRGLFAYDWQDAHRIFGRTHCYEIQGQPQSPISIEDINPEVAALARRVSFDSLRFADSLRIAVTEHMECYPKD